MLCSKYYQESHKTTTLRLILWAVFERMRPIKPNAIVIDKSATKLNAFTTDFNDNLWCWVNNVIGGEQIKCKLLLCWFHVKKMWMKHLMSHIIVDKRFWCHRNICHNCGITIIWGKSQNGFIVGQIGGALQRECEYTAITKTSQLQILKRRESTGRSLHCQVENHMQTKVATPILYAIDNFKNYDKFSIYTYLLII